MGGSTGAPPPENVPTVTYTPDGPIPVITSEQWSAMTNWVGKEIRELREKYDYIDKHFNAQLVAASSQIEYFSNQVVKWDMEALAITPRGISLFGAEVVQFPWVSWIEQSRLGVEGRARRQAADGDDGEGGGNGLERRVNAAHQRINRLQEKLPPRITGANRRMNGLEQRLKQLRTKVDRHETVIRGLLRSQRDAALTSRRSDVSPRAAQAEQRAGRLFRGAAAEQASALREVESALRAVENRARELERAL